MRPILAGLAVISTLMFSEAASAACLSGDRAEGQLMLRTDGALVTFWRGQVTVIDPVDGGLTSIARPGTTASAFQIFRQDGEAFLLSACLTKANVIEEARHFPKGAPLDIRPALHRINDDGLALVGAGPVFTDLFGAAVVGRDGAVFAGARKGVVTLADHRGKVWARIDEPWTIAGVGANSAGLIHFVAFSGARAQIATFDAAGRRRGATDLDLPPFFAQSFGQGVVTFLGAEAGEAMFWLSPTQHPWNGAGGALVTIREDGSARSRSAPPAFVAGLGGCYSAQVVRQLDRLAVGCVIQERATAGLTIWSLADDDVKRIAIPARPAVGRLRRARPGLTSRPARGTYSLAPIETGNFVVVELVPPDRGAPAVANLWILG